MLRVHFSFTNLLFYAIFSAFRENGLLLWLRVQNKKNNNIDDKNVYMYVYALKPYLPYLLLYL